MEDPSARGRYGKLCHSYTTDPDENGTPRMPGAINGGFFQKAADRPAQYPSVVIQVEDIDEHIKKVGPQEGKYLGNLGIFPESGCMYHFLIQKVNRMGMLQPIR